MKLRNQILAAALAVVASATAQASPYLGAFQTGSGYDGLLTPVTGFDIYSNGAAAFFCSTVGGCGSGIANGDQINPLDTTKPLTVGATITTYYQGVANVVNPGTPAAHLSYPGSSCNPTTSACEQITVAAKFDEIVLPGSSGFVGLFLPQAAGSLVSLFYDNNGLGVPDTTTAMPGTFITNTGLCPTLGSTGCGVGYTDGLVIASGALDATTNPTAIIINPATGILTGTADARGPLGFALGTTGPDSVGFQPLPGDFEAGTQLQAGGGITGFQTVNFFDNANGWTSVAVNPDFVVRADANVDLSAAVPEPTSVALLGIALAGLAAIRRRRGAA